ncbi:hypothetical protein OS121_01535 [Mycolicibacterium mucogenicum]|uniref:hypothetical protein n=1 Tax=Mycolicibacterium mucogenicum TaxID=56689 RepID=UPI00226A7212|nr:hypothetical protein [Mycolicibacterium mucogenicum]MCX8553783.1 hypothetical protein [Mycolicibacterium mucogenicum]
MDWDAEVDVLCVGAGIGGLATAIAAVDAAADVMVAGALPADDGRWLRGDDVHCVTLGATLDARIDEFGVPGGIPDDEPAPEAGGLGEVEAAEPDLGEQLDATAVYFAAVTAEVDDAAEPPSDGGSVPARAVRELTGSETHTRTIETFFGARVLDWARVCLDSATGALYSTVRGWSSETLRDSAGKTLRLSSLGAIEWSAGDGPDQLFDWLAAAAAERDIAVSAASTLQALLFEDHRIIGAELNTPDGPYFVRARHCVVISPDFIGKGAPVETDAAPAGTLEVCIVGLPASRFARVELVAR